MAECHSDGEGGEGGAAQLAVQPLPEKGQHQQRHPVGQECPRYASKLDRHILRVKISFG